MQPGETKEPQMRLEVVGEQRRIELEVAKSTKGAAVFVVPTPLTPMFISRYVVREDKEQKLFKLVPEDLPDMIPQGLIPTDKLADPKQLSTVLGRAISVDLMLEAGINVVVLYAGERFKIGSKDEVVDSSHIHILTQKHAKNLLLKKISPELYEQYKDKVCAATYNYFQNGQEQHIGIDATQIHQASATHDWGVRRAQEAADKAMQLDMLLNQVGLPSIQRLKNVADLQVAQKTNWTSSLVKYGAIGICASVAALSAVKLLLKVTTSISSSQQQPPRLSF